MGNLLGRHRSPAERCRQPDHALSVQIREAAVERLRERAIDRRQPAGLLEFAGNAEKDTDVAQDLERQRAAIIDHLAESNGEPSSSGGCNVNRLPNFVSSSASTQKHDTP
jgi:hypothetical protein